MFTRDMPGCCCARVITSFGGGEVYDDFCDQEDIEDIRDELKDIIKTAKRQHVAMLIATTTSNQPNAEKVLEEEGFYTSKTGRGYGGEYPSENDEGILHTVACWFLPLNEYKVGDK